MGKVYLAANQITLIAENTITVTNYRDSLLNTKISTHTFSTALQSS